jgi:hypothetical protein
MGISALFGIERSLWWFEVHEIIWEVSNGIEKMPIFHVAGATVGNSLSKDQTFVLRARISKSLTNLPN